MCSPPLGQNLVVLRKGITRVCKDAKNVMKIYLVFSPAYIRFLPGSCVLCVLFSFREGSSKGVCEDRNQCDSQQLQHISAQWIRPFIRWGPLLTLQQTMAQVLISVASWTGWIGYWIILFLTHIFIEGKFKSMLGQDKI